MSPPLSLRRLVALCRKESLQILRDPSSLLISVALPLVMLVIFGYGLNLDSSRIRVGLVMQDDGGDARGFASQLDGSPYLDVVTGSQAEMTRQLVNGKIRGMVVMASDFSHRGIGSGGEAPFQVITDGAEPNTANFVDNYVEGAWRTWQRQRAADHGHASPQAIEVEARFWFNPSAKSRNYLIPGSITIIMTVIGALLTSLVVAREWERGTMEALLATPMRRSEFLLCKILPYYALGITSLLVCVGAAIFVLHVPFRGSLAALLLMGSAFLFSTLGMGLLISTLTRNQFNAAQAALNAAFMPAMMLSGFIYEIRSMPPFVQAVTRLIPARYFVTSMQTLFQAGDVWSVLGSDLVRLTIAAVFFLGMTARKTRRRLD